MLAKDLLAAASKAQRHTVMIQLRSYGTKGPQVVVLHGGPGAPGHVAPIARGLADTFRVLEPFQRRSGEVPLTVARHVEDLHRVVETRCRGARPALVGASWGAMLALAYATAYPDQAGPLVLIGCGTFDPKSRARFEATVEARMGDRHRAAFARLPAADADARLLAAARLLDPVYSHHLDPRAPDEPERCDARGHRETWDDMLRLQAAGTYPAAFAAITSPVLMLHGAVDPHPGTLICDSLRPHLPQLDYREWARCGHYPWREQAVRSDFFATLRTWLASR